MKDCPMCGGILGCANCGYDPNEATPEPPPSTGELLDAAFAEFWHEKWPNATRDVKILERSLHYAKCREAFYAGYKVAKARTPATREPV